jgi:hypothetical protein
MKIKIIMVQILYLEAYNPFVNELFDCCCESALAPTARS